MTQRLRLDLLAGRMVRDPDGRRVGRIREVVGGIAAPGSADYVVREFHLSSGGLIEALGGTQLARVLAERFGHPSNRLVVDWRDLDLSDPAHPRLRRPLAELRDGNPQR